MEDRLELEIESLEQDIAVYVGPAKPGLELVWVEENDYTVDELAFYDYSLVEESGVC